MNRTGEYEYELGPRTLRVLRRSALAREFEYPDHIHILGSDSRSPSLIPGSRLYPPPMPRTKSLTSLRASAQQCTACPLYKDAIQAVFGEGPKTASIMLVGEQPGDIEDRRGHPFVGPAGRVLDEAIEAAGLEREALFLTNAVKHFKHIVKPETKKRLHAKPNTKEIKACHLWLEAELEVVKPKVVVLMGAVAAQSMLGPKFRVTQSRGKIVARDPIVIATYHPSAILRAPDSEMRTKLRKALIADLKRAMKASEHGAKA